MVDSLLGSETKRLEKQTYSIRSFVRIFPWAAHNPETSEERK